MLLKVLLSVLFIKWSFCQQILLQSVQRSYTLLSSYQSVYYVCSTYCQYWYFNNNTDCNYDAEYVYNNHKDLDVKVNSLCYNNTKRSDLKNKLYKSVINVLVPKNLNDSKLILINNTICNYEKGFCWNSEKTVCAVWEPHNYSNSYLYEGMMQEWTFSIDPPVTYITFSYQDKNYQLKLLEKYEDIWLTDQRNILASTRQPNNSYEKNLDKVVPKNMKFNINYSYVSFDTSTCIMIFSTAVIIFLLVLNVAMLVIQNKLFKLVDKVKLENNFSKEKNLTINKDMAYEYVNCSTKEEAALKDLVYDSVVNDLYKL